MYTFEITYTNIHTIKQRTTNIILEEFDYKTEEMYYLTALESAFRYKNDDEVITNIVFISKEKEFLKTKKEMNKEKFTAVYYSPFTKYREETFILETDENVYRSTMYMDAMKKAISLVRGWETLESLTYERI